MRVHVRAAGRREEPPAAAARKEAGSNVVTAVAETAGRAAARVANVVESLTGALRPRRKG